VLLLLFIVCITVSDYDALLLYGFMMRRPSGVGSGTGDVALKNEYKTIRSGISRRICGWC
jgi:hypothetical protein